MTTREQLIEVLLKAKEAFVKDNYELKSTEELQADALLERFPFLEWECIAHWGDTNTSIEFRKEHEWCPDEVSDITGSDRPDFCGNCGRTREEVK